MTIKSSGSLSIAEIVTEFNGNTPHSMSEYYAGGLFVTAGTEGIPASGAISLVAFYGKSALPAIIGKGYIICGLNNVAAIDNIVFATETSTVVATTIAGSSEGQSINNSTRGYNCSGFTYTYITTCTGVLFSTETAVSSSTYVTGRSGGVGLNYINKGYFAGGNTTGGTYSASMDGLNFVSDAHIVVSAVLSLGRIRSSGVNSASRGYVISGYFYSQNWGNWVRTEEIDGIDFASETAINPTVGLTVVLVGASSVNSLSSGYLLGGEGNGGPEGTIKGIDFASETTINTLAVLSSARFMSTGVNSLYKGYCCGGQNVYFSTVNEIDGIDFTTKTAINPAVSLSIARAAGVGFQSGNIM